MNSTELLEAIRNAGTIPDTGSLGATDEDLLAHADDALLSILLPKLLNTREDYYTLRERTTVTSSTTSYRIPSRAAFNKLRAIYFLDDANGPAKRMIKLDPEELGPTGGGSGPSHYRFEGNRIFLQPSDGSFSGLLEFAFYQTPGSLVTADNARLITDIDTVTRTLTLDSDAPTSWTTANRLDVHSAESGAELLLWNAAIDSITGDEIVLDAAYPVDGSLFGTVAPQVGDYVVLAGKAAAPVLPAEFHRILARAAALNFANSIGAQEQAALQEKILAVNLRETGKTTEERVEAQPLRLGREGSVTSTYHRYRPRH